MKHINTVIRRIPNKLQENEGYGDWLCQGQVGHPCPHCQRLRDREGACVQAPGCTYYRTTWARRSTPSQSLRYAISPLPSPREEERPEGRWPPCVLQSGHPVLSLPRRNVTLRSSKREHWESFSLTAATGKHWCGHWQFVKTAFHFIDDLNCSYW